MDFGNAQPGERAGARGRTGAIGREHAARRDWHARACWMAATALVAVAASCAFSAAAAQTLQPIPKLEARVTDLTGTLTAGQQAELEQKLADFEARKGAQIAVLMVPTHRNRRRSSSTRSASSRPGSSGARRSMTAHC